MRRLGTAIVSSNRFGGGTATGPRIQVGPASGTEAGTILTTEQQVAWHCQGQLLPDYIGEIDGLRLLRQGVVIGIVSRIGISGEDRRIHVDVYLTQHLGEAPAAFTPYDRVDVAAPEVLPFSRGLQLPPHSHRSHQREVQAGECRIVGCELAIGPDRPPLELPDIHSQHSRLN
jgi:hypothetical protein